MICIRLLDNDEPGPILADAVGAIRTGSSFGGVFNVRAAAFQRVPNAKFAYWVSERVLTSFATFSPLESNLREARIGPSTGDDTRYVRLAFEVPISGIGRRRRWVSLNKGGSASPYFFNYHLVIDWDEERQTFRGFCGRPGRLTERPNGLEHFFRPGISWPLRTQSGFNPRFVPAGMIFSHKGPTIFHPDSRTLGALVGLMNSTAFKTFVGLQISFGSYEVGAVQSCPVPDLEDDEIETLSDLAAEAWTQKAILGRSELTSGSFVIPALLNCDGLTLIERATAWFSRIQMCEDVQRSIQAQIDDIAFKIYGFGDLDRAAVSGYLNSSSDDEGDDSDEQDEDTVVVAPFSLVSALLDYSLGTAFGRWDIRYATGERQPPELPDPFDPLPVCPPGMLQNAEGMPAEPKDVPADYQLRISWPAILVDDENHPEDIVARVCEALEVIWKDRAEAIEQEACELLGVKTLRDYFRRPAAFFADHLKRYSKSRRQAPIYWPLSTKSGSYTLWLYYHRLTAQTLYACVNDFVEPKIKAVTADLVSMRSQLARSAKEEREFARLTDLEAELDDLRDELLRIAKFWKPNLNDGVQITAASLWACFGLKHWQSTLKDTWMKLEQGDYDWAHLACSIWPERVLLKCCQDRSLAIAHGVDEELWTELEVPENPGKRTVGKSRFLWQSKPLAEDELNAIIRDRVARTE